MYMYMYTYMYMYIYICIKAICINIQSFAMICNADSM